MTGVHTTILHLVTEKVTALHCLSLHSFLINVVHFASQKLN